MKIYAVCPNCGRADFDKADDGFVCLGCGEYAEVEELSLRAEEAGDMIEDYGNTCTSFSTAVRVR